MGQDINVHDQWAVESMGAIADRTQEHLGTTDKVIMAYRRVLQKAIENLADGKPAGTASTQAAGSARTFDGVEAAATWATDWPHSLARLRDKAQW
jgi:hypothetical protein